MLIKHHSFKIKMKHRWITYSTQIVLDYAASCIVSVKPHQDDTFSNLVLKWYN